MKCRPTIFLSGVSPEFHTFREAVEQELQMKGCFAENQPGFPPDHATVEEMLARKLGESDALVHIVGFRFGEEPRHRLPGVRRRSYTQLEFDIARKLAKPVYVFLSKDPGVRQPPAKDELPEDPAAIALQLAHRQAVTQTNHLYYPFGSLAELCKLVAEIPPVQAAGFHADLTRILKYAPEQLIGREDETKLLNDAWLQVRRAEPRRPQVLTFVALGGEGKTSLVAKWAASLADDHWPGCDAAFAWSFYSQGTREQQAASSDLFLKEALTFFGDDTDKAFAAGNAGAFEKGQRLARLVGRRRSLLILDGLEPLQYAPTSPTPGELKDQGIAALLKGLATSSQGLCVVTTRYSLPDLRAFRQTTAPELPLLRLSRAAGVHLLKTLGVTGPAGEFETLVQDVKGHALTLTLLGSYLRDAHQGDIRKRNLVNLQEADASEQGGHAFRVMAAYEWALENEGDKGQRALVVLRLLGLFDRPVTADCLAALLKAPAITNLTNALFAEETKWLWLKLDSHPLPAAQLSFVLQRLETARLLTVNRHASGALVSLDAHPLLREYFARQLREQQPAAWRAAHRRLYRHLCATTREGSQPTLEELQPLYQAVAHGCLADLQFEARTKVLRDRLQRVNEYYSTNKLGAFGAELGALACFFDTPWSRVSQRLPLVEQGLVLSQAAVRLRALGRLTEALEPMRAGLVMGLQAEGWDESARRVATLSELELTLGEVAGAVRDAEQSVIYADRSGDAFQRLQQRATFASVLQHAGRWANAELRFREAEQLQQEFQPGYPFLYGLAGFLYCDLLLAAPECAAWQYGGAGVSPAGSASATPPDLTAWSATLLSSCRVVSQRAAKTLKWAEQHLGLLDLALDHLTLGRAALYRTILEASDFRIPNPDFSHIETAVIGLRRAGTLDHLPRGLLTRAWLRFLTGARTGPDSAQADLDEAWEIAERGPMKLFLADLHLHRARLFFREPSYPWASPAADLAAAEHLIHTCGYHRRDEELAASRRAILP